ncbi:MAG: hypothetical protein IBX72_13885 [Nitrospirae bacterium]|nr:hypothetical protein [Nitrospirota bacterium]
MSFGNPYNFVFIDEKNIRRERDFLSPKSDVYSGQIKCAIRFLSNFITAGENTLEQKKQQKINNRIGIQASSLKGMLRATAEAISNSCISMMSNQYKYRFMRRMPIGTSSSSGVEYRKVSEEGRDWLVFDHKSLIYKDGLIDSCDNKKGLCICCRLFGTSAKEDKETEESFSYKGKIRLSDALYLGIYDKNGNINEKANNPIVTKYLKKHSLSNPKNHHEGFYLNGNKIKGRKFYYHHKDDKLLDSGQADTVLVELIKKDAVFEFTISFENLIKEEYGLLLTTLELEPGLGHKIGMGKPLGLGSCAIDVTEIKEFTKERYLSMGEGTGKVYKSDELQKRKDEIESWWKDGIPQDLKCILKLDPGFTEIRYPIKDIHNPANDEFSTYKKLHPPCREFSDDDKKGNAPTFDVKPTESKEDKSSLKGIIADAFKKAKKMKK